MPLSSLRRNIVAITFWLTLRQFIYFLERCFKFVEADLFPLFWQLVLQQENMIPAFSCNLKNNGHRGETTLL